MLGENKILKIALLGPPLVTFADQVQTIKRKRTRSVLYFLACQKDPVSRETLISKFWPNLSEQEARKNLREILSNLRAQFSNTDVIVSRYDQLSLNFEYTEVDVIHFRNVVDRVHFTLSAMPSGKLPDSIYREVREGVTLWRAPLFMEGFSQRLPEVETWILETGNELQAWRQKLVERLADHCIFSGNLDEAIYWLYDALKTEPLKTDLHYLVLTCLRDCGQTSAIYQYREALERIYKTTYGLEVPQVLTEFIERISDSQKQFVTLTPSTGQNPPPSSTPFVGRKEVLHQLRTWALRGGIVLLRGESGIGKTRTLQEFYSRIDFPFRSLFFNARPLEQQLPMLPFIEGLRQAIKKDEWLALDPVHAEALGGLFPEITRIRQDISAPTQLSLQDSSPVIFDAILALLSPISREKRLLVFVDNAQWMDELSISLLSFITSRGIFHKNGFLLLSSRVGERNPFLHRFITHVQTRSDFHQLDLDYMGDAEIEEFAYSLLGRVPSADLITRLKRDVGGNPLFLLHTLKLMMDFSTNVDSLAGMQNFPIAREALALMKERLENLDPSTRNVLDNAAVIGDVFTSEIIEDVVQVKPEQLPDILDDLVDLHMLRIDPIIKPGGGYAFTSVRMRQALLMALSPARKRMLNKQLIQALQRRYGTPPSMAESYAKYYEAAGEMKLAYRHWLLAAHYAIEKAEMSNVFNAYGYAFALLEPQTEQFSDIEIHNLIAPWCAFAFDQNDLQTCDRLYRKCLEWGKQRHSQLLQGTAHSGLAKLMGLKKQLVTAENHMKLAFKNLAKCSPGVELINAHINQGYLHHLDFDLASAREQYEIAAELPVEIEDELTLICRATARAVLSVIYSEMGELQKADVTADLSVEGGLSVGCIQNRVQGTIAKCLAQFYMANYREVLDLATDVIHDLDSVRMTNWATLFYSILSSSYLCVGQLDKAWAYTEKSLGSLHEFTPAGMGAQVHGLRGDIYRMLENWEGAEREYAAGADQRDKGFFALENLYKLGFVKWRKGDAKSGIPLIEEAIAGGELHGLGMITLPAEAMLAVYNSSLHDQPDFEHRLEEIYSRANARGLGTLPLSIKLSRLVEKSLNTSDVWKPQSELENLALTVSNIWLEFSIQLQIINSLGVPDEVKKRSQTRVHAILDMLLENALSDPVRELTREYVEKIEGKMLTYRH